MISKLISFLYFTSWYYLCVFELASGLNLDIEDPVKFNSTDLKSSDVKFLLFTKSNRGYPRSIYIDDEDSLSAASYNKSRPTKFMIHGWNGNADSDCVVAVRKGFEEAIVANVIVVEWKRLAESENYADAAQYVRGVAKVVARMTDFLIERGTRTNELTIAGHSLGAHIAGLAAHLSKNRIPHVVAMDPAGPGFTKHDREGRVHVSDAELVETIHTNTRLVGYRDPIGRVDYFPNGGEFQPGCRGPDSLTANFCSHIRACFYYGEALRRGDRWLARKCDSYEKFEKGECKDELIVQFVTYTHEVDRQDGSYYLRTNDNVDRQGLYGRGTDGV